jgi:hypothetical protein
MRPRREVYISSFFVRLRVRGAVLPWRGAQLSTGTALL